MTVMKDKTGRRRMRISPAAAVFAVIAGILVLAPGVAQAGAVLNEARTLSKTGETDRAIELLQSETPKKEGGEKAALLNAQGWLQFSSGRNAQAVDLFSDAMTLAKDAQDAGLTRKIRNNLALTYFVTGRLDEAKELFTRSSAEGSKFATTYLGLIEKQMRVSEFNNHLRDGIAMRLEGNFLDAISEYDKALEIQPDHAAALEYRGYAYYRLGKYGAAEKDLQTSRELDPTRVTVAINLIKVYCATGNDAGLKEYIASAEPLILEERKVIESDGELQKVCGDRLGDFLPG